MTRPTPPAIRGFPLIGNALEFRKNPVDTLMRGYQALGPVFSIRLGPMRAAVLIGPEHHRFFFSETDHTLSMSAVYQAFVPIFGQGFTLAVDGQEYQEQRAILRPAFHPSKMAGYLEVMQTEARRWIATLGDAGTFDLCEAFEQLAVHTVACAVMGYDFRERMGLDFGHLYRDVVRGIEVMLPPNLPLPRFRRRDRARRILHGRIGALIHERRAQPGQHDDFLQSLAEATYSDGRPIPVSTLESMILFLVFSASESSPLQAGWALIYLLQNPDYLATVVAEQARELRDRQGHIGETELARLPRLEWAIKESERLRPMTTMLWRKTVQPYDVGGYQVPAGWITIICPAVAHRLPQIFSNPDRYDPERFAPDRAEDRSTPYSMAGFGGGHHKCPGFSFAYNWMKVLFTALLAEYSLDLVNPHPKVDFSSSISRPESPCLIRYRRRPPRQGALAEPILDQLPVV